MNRLTRWQIMVSVGLALVLIAAGLLLFLGCAAPYRNPSCDGEAGISTGAALPFIDEYLEQQWREDVLRDWEEDLLLEKRNG